MTQLQTALRLRIHQGEKVSQRYLMPHERFSIGRSSDNDVVLLGEAYPKKHVLIFNNNNRTLMRLPKFAEGEVWINDSKLSIQDLTKHRLLPAQGDAFILPIFEGKEGVLSMGNNTRIEFAFTKVTVSQAHLQPFDGFSWSKVFIKDLTKDIYFKLIFLFLLLLNSIVLYAYKDIEIVKKQEDIEKQTQRLLKISMRIIPKKELEARANPMAQSSKNSDSKDSEDEDKPAKKKTKSRKAKNGKQKRGNQNTSSGLLGLIAGTGNSNQGSSVLDLLVDKGLTADLNRALGSGSNLKRGKGGRSSNSEDILSGLIGTGGGTGGIDDLIGDYIDDEVEVVKLKKRTQVKVQKATEASISKDAQGHRTQESVARVVRRVTGRLQYIYQKYLKRDVDFRGKVVVEFTIAANGKVSNARVRESTTGNSAFDQEIVRAVRRLKFPVIPKGIASFVYPFVFQRMD